MTKFSNYGLVLLFVLSSAFFAACGEDEPTNEPPASAITQPKAGSTYTYTEYETENGVKDDATEETVTSTILETGLTFEGKSNVVKDEDSFEDGSRDTAYFAYESNDDISIWFDAGEESDGDPDDPFGSAEPRWITFPFGAKQNNTYTVLSNDSVNATLTTSYLRTEKGIVNGEERDVWVGQMQISATLTPSIGPQLTLTQTVEISFMPSIGNLFRSESTMNNFIGGGTSGEVRQLVSFSLVI